ncbi:hypothetical protein QCA50_017894 [Cerrena zonata]|uniref:Uncharacterized protein n=1 Tax=Cerrena zonata TaxID=2478898 RepID=A0AAW0FFW6_9APHY
MCQCSFLLQVDLACGDLGKEEPTYWYFQNQLDHACDSIAKRQLHHPAAMTVDCNSIQALKILQQLNLLTGKIIPKLNVKTNPKH